MIKTFAPRHTCRAVFSSWLIGTLSLGLVASAQAQAPAQKTYCNPLDINYQYNFEQKANNISFRSAADPVILKHQGDYYLFATISGGWWHSTNLLHWTYVKPSIWPSEDMCAPAAVSVQNKLYLFQSTFDRRPIYLIDSPKTGKLSRFTEPLPYMPGAGGPWDPALFHDEGTDRWYMYFGSSNLYPLYGIELDYNNNLNYLGTARELLHLNPERHGWERFGQDHRETIKPFMEGAEMIANGGKYYLQYSAPGTEYNVYANGAYVGDTPLGPFHYAPNNPISYKPGGFATGAGHGNTFQDYHGNFWNTGTTWIGINLNTERRLVLFPAGFDAEGLLYSNTRFGDFPHFLANGKWQKKDELFSGWMLLSYRKPCVASSFREAFSPANAADENPRSFWVASTNQPGQWLTLDLGHAAEVKAVQVNFTDYKSNLYTSGINVYTQFKLHASRDGTNWTQIADLSGEKRDRPNAYLELAHPVRARYIKYEHVHVAAPNLAISDLRVFGNTDGPAPATPAKLRVRRDFPDTRNAFITWEEVPGAVGYNILWGIRDDKLYQTYQVFGDQKTALELRALTVGQEYSFAVEAFNESGVSAVSGPVRTGAKKSEQ